MNHVHNNLQENVTVFQEACDDTVAIYNPRQLARYTGMQMEELCEKLTAVAGGGEEGVPVPPELLDLIVELELQGRRFKAGDFDKLFVPVSDLQRKEMLDADIDLAWVSFGSANSIGADVDGAVGKVSQANLSKVGPDGKVLRDANGKIMKPLGFTSPDLGSCLYPVAKPVPPVGSIR